MDSAVRNKEAANYAPHKRYRGLQPFLQFLLRAAFSKEKDALFAADNAGCLWPRLNYFLKRLY